MIHTPQPPLRDVALRASIRMTADGDGAMLGVRVGGTSNSYYRLALNPREKYVVVMAMAASQGRLLARYPLEGSYKGDEWVRLELRVVGDEITISEDGKVLGVVRDSAIGEPGGVCISTDANGYFRDVEYLPLDPGTLGKAPAPPTSATATKDAPFVNSLGMKFVPVPITGGPTAGERVLFSVWETRVQDYEVFVKEAGREWPKPDFPQEPTHPAVAVSWEDANAFCVWLTQRELEGGGLPAKHRYRLPSDHEWSCAVDIGSRERATDTPVEKSGQIPDLYPWGRSWPPPAQAGNFAGEELAAEVQSGHPWIKTVLAGYSDGYPRTAPVASFPASELGIFDLAGNVWEWCQDRSGKDEMRVIRGGSWELSARTGLLLSERYYGSPVNRVSYRGFRVVLAPAE